MANISLGSKYLILSKFTTFPKTSKIEEQRAALLKEYNELEEFRNSSELIEFLELEKYLDSKEYKQLVESTQSAKKEEEDKVKSYETKKKSKPFKVYFRFKDSAKLKEFVSFGESKDLKDFEELEKEVTSGEFANQKKEAEDRRAAEEEKIREFESLKKSKQVKNHFKFEGSEQLKRFIEISESGEIERYHELEKESNQGKAGEDKQTELNRLKKSSDVKFYLKFKESPKYKSYLAFKDSPELKKYHELEEYLNSKEHKERLREATEKLQKLQSKEKEYQQRKKSGPVKKYYKFQDSAKYKAFKQFEESKELSDYLELEKYLSSEDHKKMLESLAEKENTAQETRKKYEDFKNSKKYKWFLSIKESDKFDEIKRWELVFEDGFKDKKLNPEKWMTRYFWGDKLINDAYAFEHDAAFPTDGKNVEISGSNAKIIVRKEKAKGKVWKQPFGFIPQDFDFTTGLISTAKSHRQKYGKVEAKIKVNYSKPVNYNFWMASERNLPHVDVMKLEKKKSRVEVAHHTGKPGKEQGPESHKGEFSGLDISQDHFIYTLEWYPDKLIWKINDVVVNEETQHIPTEEMYIVFSSSLTGKVNESSLPASMEIDWVRCYRENK